MIPQNTFQTLSAIALLACLTFGTQTTQATQATQARTSEEDVTIRLIRDQFQDVDLRRVLEVSGKMELDDPTATLFWPIYRAYLLEVAGLRDQQLENLSEYAKKLNSGRVDDAGARALLARSLELEQARLTARTKLIEKAGRVLSPTQTLHLYQIELTMDAALKSGLLKQIPTAQ